MRNQKLENTNHPAKLGLASTKRGKKPIKYRDEFAFYLFKFSVSKHTNIQPKSHA